MSLHLSVAFHLWPDFLGNEASESVRSPCAQLPDGSGAQRLTPPLCNPDVIIVVVRALNYTHLSDLNVRESSRAKSCDLIHYECQLANKVISKSTGGSHI